MSGSECLKATIFSSTRAKTGFNSNPFMFLSLPLKSSVNSNNFLMSSSAQSMVLKDLIASTCAMYKP